MRPSSALGKCGSLKIGEGACTHPSHPLDSPPGLWSRVYLDFEQLLFEIHTDASIIHFE